MRLGNRAFDILAALVEGAGEVIAKDELIARVWPTTFVEEANPKIQVSPRSNVGNALIKPSSPSPTTSSRSICAAARAHAALAAISWTLVTQRCCEMEVAPARGTWDADECLAGNFC